MQTLPPPAEIDWPSWLRRYDTQQTAYLPDREERFTAMLDVLGALLPEEFVALDLACGPGSISQRLLDRFPRARVVAVDMDPVLLAMGMGALGDYDGRLRWITADLNDPGWIAELGEPSFDAVLSTTSLQWLQVEPLVRLYNTLGKLVREDGVFMNGDNLAFAPHQETLRLLSEATIEMQRAEAFDAGGVEDWDEWWAALAQEGPAGPLLAERTRRFAAADRDSPVPIFDVHEAALRNAGFREVGTIWQRLDNRVLLAVR
ncbi:MAG: class I SAM-dependent methyltransferase [Thermomicrobiales bacterium]